MSRAKHPLYSTWRNMRRRCLSPKCSEFRHYGGRGIKICAQWLDSFETFAEDMGPKPSAKHSLDRIDNDGDYSPANCRWATQHEQSRNRTDTVLVTFQGEQMLLKDAAAKVGIEYQTVFHRVRRGWSPEKALNTPPHSGKVPLWKVRRAAK